MLIVPILTIQRLTRKILIMLPFPHLPVPLAEVTDVTVCVYPPAPFSELTETFAHKMPFSFFCFAYKWERKQ